MANNTVTVNDTGDDGRMPQDGDVDYDGQPEETEGDYDITKSDSDIINDGPGEKQSFNDGDLTREGAVDDFLAGENKDDDILLNNIDNEDEGISFKRDNFILECNDQEDGYYNESEKSDGEERDDENDKSLNKMHIMEDVREGCNIQPSSPGHAEQRTKEENSPGNGYNSNGSDLHVEIDVKSECKIEAKDSESELFDVEKTQLSANHINDDHNSNGSSAGDNQNGKRKSDSEESPLKRIRTEIQDNFISRDKILNGFIELADCSTIDQIQSQTELILSQIKTLNEMAKEKEREWNNIIHVKKIKEELLLRIQRKKQIMLMSENSDLLISESQTDNGEERLTNSSQSLLKSNWSADQREKSKHRQILNRCSQNGLDVGVVDYRQGKRPVIDVQSLIADYRQRHPEAVPRRGRRIRSLQTESKNHIVNMALGSGAQVKHNSSVDDLGMLLNSVNSNNFTRMGGDSSMQDNSFKDMLVQLAKLSQSERNELIQNAIKPPPPYPEVTVHPVPTTTPSQTNSLLHGILTKSPQKANSKTSFSPTLARLLTAPERAHNHLTSTPTMSGSTMIHSSSMSISEILSSNKARNEITITPVGNYDAPPKTRNEDEEIEDSADRLVIDETSEVVDGRRSGDNNSDTGDEVPQCQGCNLKPAQFVCAGCGNQWYCSRDCQVSAWDEHSEICSG